MIKLNSNCFIIILTNGKERKRGNNDNDFDIEFEKNFCFCQQKNIIYIFNLAKCFMVKEYDNFEIEIQNSNEMNEKSKPDNHSNR